MSSSDVMGFFQLSLLMLFAIVAYALIEWAWYKTLFFVKCELPTKWENFIKLFNVDDSAFDEVENEDDIKYANDLKESVDFKFCNNALYYVQDVEGSTTIYKKKNESVWSVTNNDWATLPRRYFLNNKFIPMFMTDKRIKGVTCRSYEREDMDFLGSTKKRMILKLKFIG